MLIKLCDKAFDPWQSIIDYQSARPDWSGKFGATNVFVGTMRDYNQGDSVQSMYLEHYPGMTERQLRVIVEQALDQWALLDALVVHRVGEVRPDDPLVVVAVWSEHRGDAFDACRFIMEQLKSRAPFWKKERLVSGGQRWVEKNSGGYKSSGH